MAKKALPAIVWKEGSWFVAKTIGLELASQGRSKKEALKNLQEALDFPGSQSYSDPGSV